MNSKIDFIAIGDEILTGKISDTNSTFVAQILFDAGFELSEIHVIPDNLDQIKNTLVRLSKHSRVVIVTGGLGPTSDDITVAAVCSWLGVETEVHDPSKQKIISFFNARGRPIFPHSLKQAQIPKGAEIFFNEVGHAPGIKIQLGECVFYFMPGVPHEMKPMFEGQIWPSVRGLIGGGKRGKSRTWRCLDITESDLQEKMNPIEADLPKGWRLGYRTTFPENHLTLYGKSDRFEEVSKKINSILGPFSYTTEPLEIEALVLKTLLARKQRIALAESCTGGLVASRLSSLPDASKVLWGSAVAYQVSAKDKLLGVSPVSPEEAVSQRCTLELAKKVLRLSGAEVGAAITGYAGPTGGTEENPIGTVYLCVTDGSRTIEKRIQFPSGRARQQIQWAGATYLFRTILNLF